MHMLRYLILAHALYTTAAMSFLLLPASPGKKVCADYRLDCLS